MGTAPTPVGLRLPPPPCSPHPAAASPPPPFYQLLFLYPPLHCISPPSPVACPLRLPVATFFFFGGLGGSGSTAFTSLELVVQLKLEEEE